MKTAEQIAASHSLSSCRNCQCAIENGGVCKRLVGMLSEGALSLFSGLADAFDKPEWQTLTTNDLVAAIREVVRKYRAPAP